MAPIYFATADDFRGWLEANHSSANELILGFHNKSAKKSGITYSEALDEALCFGWIDGIVHKVDAHRHTRRFTPRRSGSIWSNINLGHVQRLMKSGRMLPAGIKAFAAHKAAKSGIYSYEQNIRPARPETFPSVLEKIFRKDRNAWAHWQLQPPGYRRTVIWWVSSAKQEATRERRLQRLIAASATGRRLDF